MHDGERLVHIGTAAFPFTGVMAHPTAYAGKRVIFFKKRQSFAVFSLADQGDIPLYTHVGGTSGSTGSGALFFNGKGAGNRLWVSFVDRLSIRKAFVVIVANRYGANFNTFSATGTFGKIHKSRFLPNAGREMTGFTLKIQQFGVC